MELKDWHNSIIITVGNGQKWGQNSAYVTPVMAE